MEETINKTLPLTSNKNIQDYKGHHTPFNNLKKYFSKRSDCWYLEKTNEGNFAMEYFSSVKERQHFFREYKGLEMGSENLGSKKLYKTFKDSDK